MIRVALDLENPEDLRSAKAEWKFAPGLVPGEDNEGLVARLSGSPARLADYDDSGWEVCENVQVVGRYLASRMKRESDTTLVRETLTESRPGR